MQRAAERLDFADPATLLMPVAAEGEQSLLAHQRLERRGLRADDLDGDPVVFADALDERQRLAVEPPGVEREDAERADAGGALRHVDQHDILRAAEGDAQPRELCERLGQDVGRMAALEPRCGLLNVVFGAQSVM